VVQTNERRWRLPVGPREIAACALAAFGLIAAAVTTVAVVESYGNLLAFALAHGLSGWRAAIAPAAVDSFIVMGELLLFASILQHWRGWAPYALGSAMAAWGFALSVGGNVWHAASATVADRAVSAIWPVTATAGLAGGLIIAKRLIGAPRTPPPAPAPPPREPRVRAARGPGQAAARSGDRAATELILARELAALPQPWPGQKKLARTEPRLRGSVRSAARVKDLAASLSNGAGHDGRDGS
jgi:hypothetical protein